MDRAVEWHRRSEPRLTLRRVLALYGTFGPHLVPYWRSFLLAYAALAGAVLATLVKPWPLKLVFDHVLLDRPLPAPVAGLAALAGADKVAVLSLLAAGIVLVVVLDGVFSYVHKYALASAAERMVTDVRRRVFDHLQLLPPAFHGAERSGDLVLRLTSDIQALKRLLIDAAHTLATYLFTVGSVLATMLWMDWRLTLVASAVLPVLYLLSFRVSRRVEALARAKRAKESEVASIVQETVASIPVVQAFAREEEERSRFAKATGESLHADLKRMRLSRTLRRAVQVVIAAGTAAVVWYGAWRALAGEMSPGDLIVFTAYLKTLYAPAGGLSELLTDLLASLVAADRIAELLETERTVRDRPGAVAAPRFRGAVAFERVTFGYRLGEPVLRELSFAVEPGQMVALVGSSGTGKSTVVSLLVRFADPWEGRVLIDGRDIRDFTLESLRRQMSVVLQEPLLLRRTVRDNIAYGRPEATFDEIVAAARAAEAHEFIAKLPDGYDTLLSERGVNLSGGQRQRIALARAILRDAPIVVLDEPVAGLDAVTEARLHETLARFLAGRTAFVIAHSLATLRRADLILVLEAGTVVEQGTHAQLLADSRAYRRFYELQHGPLDSVRAHGGLA
ncbi:MAG TPA: ABC transporter ATP-binding protein [Thermodesulfobacteriota bacterium]|nr:ABC transporter ATP-binding protein [Thermodesulfobacteriota bacterium]